MNSTTLGGYLALLRDRAQKKQAELARELGWSQAVLSRIESGEREATPAERAEILRAIGTAEAAELERALDREWNLLEAPVLGHPDHDLLWSAEAALRKLNELEEREDLKNAFARRVRAYKEELEAKAKLLAQADYNIAFVGAIGVGKSTALCRATELEVFDRSAPTPLPVLEAGGGGVTICEVRVKQGPGYGIIVEPAPEESIRREVMVYAEVLMESVRGDSANESEDDAGQDAQGMSKEITRAIRNMAKLRTRKEKDSSGKIVRIDEAKEIAAASKDAHTLGVEILTRMGLAGRDRRIIWYDPKGAARPAYEWLEDTFKRINNGRHPEFSLPQRIDIVVPDPVLKSTFPTLRVVDTKGIDGLAPRADLEGHFTEPHTITVLCSSFNDAPAQGIQALLGRMASASVRRLDRRAAVLVLPRPGEAMAVKDDDGHVAESTKEGYELKHEQVADQLRSFTRGEPPIPIAFFNAREDSPTELVSFLIERVNALRDLHRENLAEVVHGAQTLLQNAEESEVQAVQQQASQRIRVWLRGHREIEPAPAHVKKSLLAAMRAAHVGSIRASIRRDGEWPNLDYAHNIGYGSRLVAAAAIGPARTAFQSIVANLLEDEELDAAHEMIQQAVRILDTGTEDILQKAQWLGQATYLDNIKADQQFWEACNREWGRGPGYKDRVGSHNEAWFDDVEHQSYGAEVAALVEREWKALLERLEGILEPA